MIFEGKGHFFSFFSLLGFSPANTTVNSFLSYLYIYIHMPNKNVANTHRVLASLLNMFKGDFSSHFLVLLACAVLL